MSKETDGILKAYQLGEADKRAGRPCNNQFKKGSMKRRAYRNGFNTNSTLRNYETKSN